MKEMIMWDKYDNKYREVVDVEVARGLEADLYEANNRIVDYMDIIEERDRLIDWLVEEIHSIINLGEFIDNNINKLDTKEQIIKYFEERCNDAENKS